MSSDKAPLIGKPVAGKPPPAKPAPEESQVWLWVGMFFMFLLGAGIALSISLPILIPQIPTASPTVRPSFKPTTRAPTLNPTRNPTAPTPPTKTPTKNPTKNPTPPTPAPTQFPTKYQQLIFFASGFVLQGNLGDRATTTALCASFEGPPGCIETPMLISYTGDEVKDFPTQYGFDPQDPIYGPTGQLILTSWDLIALGDPYTLSHTLLEAEVFGNPPAHVYFWTGTTTLGAVGGNCNEWTDNVGFSGVAGSILTNQSDWIDVVQPTCKQYLLQVCVCIK